MTVSKFTYFPQYDATDCGIACIRMIAMHYNKKVDMSWLRARIPVGYDGVSLLSISEGARQLGFKTVGIMLSFEQLCEHAPLPCIAHWGQNHFVVIWRVKKKRNGWKIYVADPAIGLLQYNEEEVRNKLASLPTIFKYISLPSCPSDGSYLAIFAAFSCNRSIYNTFFRFSRRTLLPFVNGW